MATVRIPARRERWAEASAPAPTRSASELIYSAGSRFAPRILGAKRAHGPEPMPSKAHICQRLHVAPCTSASEPCLRARSGRRCRGRQSRRRLFSCCASSTTGRQPHFVLPHQLRGLADRLIGSDQMGSFVLTSCAFVVVSSLRGCDDTYAARHRRAESGKRSCWHGYRVK